MIAVVFRHSSDDWKTLSWYLFFESGKDVAAKGETWVPLLTAVSKIQWACNPHTAVIGYGKLIPLPLTLVVISF